jgi:hypothetical protein
MAEIGFSGGFDTPNGDKSGTKVEMPEFFDRSLHVREDEKVGMSCSYSDREEAAARDAIAGTFSQGSQAPKL